MLADASLRLFRDKLVRKNTLSTRQWLLAVTQTRRMRLGVAVFELAVAITAKGSSIPRMIGRVSSVIRADLIDKVLHMLLIFSISLIEQRQICDIVLQRLRHNFISLIVFAWLVRP